MGEAKRRAKTQASQIIVCYESEPYLAFEVTPAMAQIAINPDADDEWLIGAMNWLRDEVALIRDHSTEVLHEEKQRTTLIYNAIIIVQYLLTTKQQRLDKIPCVMLNLFASQSTAEPNCPAFEIAGLSQPLSVDEIRQMSTARHLFMQDGDGVKEYVAKTESSKDRSKTRSCVTIAAYWRNEKPGGLGLTMDAPDGGNLNAEMELLDQLVLKLAETKPSAKDCEEYLSHMARQKATGIEVAAAIAFAEEAGFLVSDEFNGMIYIYRNEDQFYIERKDGGSMSGTISP